MRAVIHIGAPKTGTSALQFALSESRHRLLAKGVLYPSTPSWFPHHGLCSADLGPRLSRGLQQLRERDPESFDAEVRRQNQLIVDEIAQFAPALAILSSEYFFMNVAYMKDRSIFHTLHKAAGDLRFVAYVRAPANWYLSAVQQALKASWSPPDPEYRMRHIFEAYERRFPGALTVRRYVDGGAEPFDIVEDFRTAIMPEIGEPLPALRLNETMSAEAMVILQDHRRTQFPNENGIFKSETSALIAKLLKQDKALAGWKAPMLRPEMERAISASAVDALRLRENHGIVFDGFDYGAVGAQEAGGLKTARVEDICMVDQDRLRLLAESLAQSSNA